MTSCKAEVAAAIAIAQISPRHGSMTIESGVDLNSTRHRFRLLRNRDGQDAVFPACVDLLPVRRIRQYEAPMKMSVASLDTPSL
jgi:hypothetical protein